MPGKRDKRIRNAFLQHVASMQTRANNPISEKKAEELINKFDSQVAKDNSYEIKYFNALSDNEFEQQIKLFEKCEVNIDAAFKTMVEGQKGPERSTSEAGIFRALFAPETNRSDIQMVFAGDQDFNNKIEEVQNKTDAIKIPVPEGVTAEMIELANLGIFLKSENIEKVQDILEQDKRQNPVSGATKDDAARTGFFENMIKTGDRRSNMHYSRFIVPDTRTQCNAAVSEYINGNPQPLADAIYEAFVQCHDGLIASRSKDDNLYYFWIETMEKCVKALDSPALKDCVSLSTPQKEFFHNMVKEKNLYDENSQIGQQLFNKMSLHTFDSLKADYNPDSMESKPLNDPEFEKLYFDYVATGIIQYKAKEEVQTFSNAKGLSGDLDYQKKCMTERPFSDFEILSTRQKDILIKAIVETVIKPSQKYKDSKECNWLQLASKIGDEVSWFNRQELKPIDFELEYPERIKNIRKMKEDFSSRNDDKFKDVLAAADEALKLDEELNKNGKPSFDQIREKVPGVFKKIYDALNPLRVAVNEEYSAKQKTKEDAAAVYQDILTIGEYCEGVDKIDEKINSTIAYRQNKKLILDEFVKLGGSLDPIKNGGRFTEEEHIRRDFLEEMGLTEEDLAASAEMLGLSTDEYLKRIMDENARAERNFESVQANQPIEKTPKYKEEKSNVKASNLIENEQLSAIHQYTEDFAGLMGRGLKEGMDAKFYYDKVISVRRELESVVKGEKKASPEDLKDLMAKALMSNREFMLTELGKVTSGEKLESKFNAGVEALKDNAAFKMFFKEINSDNLADYFGKEGDLNLASDYVDWFIENKSLTDTIMKRMDDRREAANGFDVKPYKRFALKNSIAARETLFDIYIKKRLTDENDERTVHEIAKLICCEEIANDPNLIDTFGGDQEKMERVINIKTQKVMESPSFKRTMEKFRQDELYKVLQEEDLKQYSVNENDRINRIQNRLNNFDAGVANATAKIEKPVVYQNWKDAHQQLLDICKGEKEASLDETRQLISKYVFCDSILAKKGKKDYNQKILDEEIYKVYTNPAFTKTVGNAGNDVILDVLDTGGSARFRQSLKNNMSKEEKDQFKEYKESKKKGENNKTKNENIAENKNDKKKLGGNDSKKEEVKQFTP